MDQIKIFTQNTKMHRTIKAFGVKSGKAGGGPQPDRGPYPATEGEGPKEFVQMLSRKGGTLRA